MRKKDIVYFKQDKIYDIEKSFSLHSVIVPANHAVTFEYFINEGSTTKKPVILLCVIQGLRLMRRSIRNINIPPPGKPRAFEFLKIELFKFPPPWAKIVFKYPTLALDFKCPS